MRKNNSGFPATAPLLAWTKLAWKTGEMMAASAQVIQHRSNRIACAGPVPCARDQREFRLMGQEKIEAAIESAQALAARMMIMQTQFSTFAFRQFLNSASRVMTLAANPAAAMTMKGQETLLWRPYNTTGAINSHLSGAIARLAQHGLMPIHARATKNARRLGKL